MAGRVVLHIDMDAFYAAVERLDDPSLAGEPVVVGADPEEGEGRGVVATASYEAREHGIHSAQPISRAWERAPDETVWLRPRIGRYQEVGEEIFDEIADRVDVFESASIDEAYADVTERCGGSIEAGAELARDIQDHVRSAYDLTCSIGVGPNKLVAKIASDLDKPDGLTVVDGDEVMEVIGPLDADVIPGVGPKTAAALSETGIETVADLAGADVEAMRDRFGKRGPEMVRRARGEDDRPVDPTWQRKSIGTERTFGEDLDPAQAPDALDDVADEAAARLRSRGLRGRTVTVKIRLADFETFTRSRTVGEPIDDPTAIRRVARRLLDRFGLDDPVRLLGVRISNLDRRGLRQATLDEFGGG